MVTSRVHTPESDETSDDSGDAPVSGLDEAIGAAQAIMAKIAPKERILSEELIADRREEVAAEKRERIDRMMAEFAIMREEITLGEGITIRELIDEGRE